MRLIGPVAGGALVASSAGLAFTIDAASFAACPRSRAGDAHGARVGTWTSQTSRDAALKEGLRFVRGRVWLWGTLLSAASRISCFLVRPKCSFLIW